MEGGGWSLLNVWLSDGKKSQNVSFLLEILQVSSSCYYLLRYLFFLSAGVAEIAGQHRSFKTGLFLWARPVLIKFSFT